MQKQSPSMTSHSRASILCENERHPSCLAAVSSFLDADCSLTNSLHSKAKCKGEWWRKKVINNHCDAQS